MSAAAAAQVHRAGQLFSKAADLATGDVSDAFRHIADVALGVSQGDAYTFAAYTRVTSACAANGL